jgi:glycine/D-amino acid oxidase-like deaminating enzyme
MQPDVVVIGGGIIGACCAYYLSRAGVKVHLVENGSLASGASGACEGSVLLWDKQPGIMLELGKAGAALYAELLPQLPFGIEYVKKGSIMVVERPEDLPGASCVVKSMQDAGVPCQSLTTSGLLELEPNLAEDVAGGAVFPDDVQIQPMLAVLALCQAARDSGAVIQPFAPVHSIEVKDGRVAAVNTAAGRIPTNAVVNAAGVWSRAIGEMVGVNVPVVPRKGHIVVTEPTANVVRRKMMEAAYTNTVDTNDQGLSIAAVVEHTESGNILLGSSREFVGFDRAVDYNVIQAMVARAIRFFPCLKGVHAIRTYAGLRPFPPDHMPIIGEADSIKGFYVATGHEGTGIGFGPITGKLIMQMLTGHKLDLPVERLSPSRFASGS